MCVCAADAESADSGPARMSGRLPFRRLCVDKERAGFEIDLRVGFLKMKTGGNELVLERKHRLDQSGDARGSIEVSDIGLDGTDCAEAFLLRLRSKSLSQGPQLDWIAQRRSSTVSLDV